MFAATCGLAATLFAHHPMQVVITGHNNDPVAQALEVAAHRVYRLGKAVLRIEPGFALTELPSTLKETLPHLLTDKAAAIVCAGRTCMPPTSDPTQLIALLENGLASAASI
jgi:uncharacterized protein YyaL (SSP411 family)